MRPVLAFVLSLVVLAVAPGCKSRCRQLSEQLCQCITTTVDRDACLANAANQEGRYPPTAEQDDNCGELLQGCSCFTINTPEGKEACGLAVD
jgi:hypothetical protein